MLLSDLRVPAAARGLDISAAPKLEAGTDYRVPARLTRGPLAGRLPERLLDAASAAWYQKEGRALGGNVRFEIVNFIDGVRTVSEIRNGVSAESGPIVARFLGDLVKAKLPA